MEAGFGFGPQFGAKPKFIRAGIKRVLDDLEMPKSARAKLYKAVVAAAATGDPRIERAAVKSSLDSVTWRWPWFERMGKLFDDNGTWPVAWIEYDILPPFQWDNIPIDTREDFLNVALVQAPFNAQHFAQMQESMELGIACISVAGWRENCEVERTFVEVYRPRIEAGDYGVLPPFFPGDTSRISWLSRRAMRRRDGG